MSEKRASTASGSYAKAEPKGGDPLARLSDHLGRLLGHADELLAEWQGHADGVRARLDAQAREAGKAFEEAVAGALAEAGSASAAELERAFGASAAKLRSDLERARQAAADLDAHMQRVAGGVKPPAVDELRAIAGKLDAIRRGKSGTPWALALGVTANLLVVAVLVLVWTRTADRPTGPVAQAPPPAPAAPVVVPDAPPAPPPAAKRPCSELAGDTAAKLVAECVAHVCGIRLEPPLKPGGYARVLAACKPEDPAARDLVAAMQALERDRTLEKLACPPEKDGSVTVRWLLDCPQTR
jgi:hypothetical protein